MTMNKLHPLQKNRKGHMAQQPTMNNIYEGPSTLVRTQTQQNVYPQVQQQQVVVNQGGNPHYGQAPPTYAHSNNNNLVQQQSVYGQQQVVQQQPFNPNYNVSATAPPI
eukprot:UN06553